VKSLSDERRQFGFCVRDLSMQRGRESGASYVVYPGEFRDFGRHSS